MNIHLTWKDKKKITSETFKKIVDFQKEEYVKYADPDMQYKLLNTKLSEFRDLIKIKLDELDDGV